MERGGSTYIITNKYNTTIYTGSSTHLYSRICEHRSKVNPYSFTAKYNLWKLVYYKSFSTIQEAREWEYYIKGKKRIWKINLITSFNPDWDDLFCEIEDWD